jgi:hypothetical protein
MKKGSTFVRICLFIICLLLTTACTNQQIKIRDEEHKTFYVNGFSALDGYEAVSNSLKNMGFTIDKNYCVDWAEKDDFRDGVLKNDFRSIGEGFYYSANYYAKSLTTEQLSKLTYGLFDNLPSGFTFNKNENDSICNVYLEWYMSGEIKKCRINFDVDDCLSPKDCVEVNKRLSALFPHSKISDWGGSLLGYKNYYDDNGVSVFFPNFTMLEISKEHRE